MCAVRGMLIASLIRLLLRRSASHSVYDVRPSSLHLETRRAPRLLLWGVNPPLLLASKGHAVKIANMMGAMRICNDATAGVYECVEHARDIIYICIFDTH